MKQSVATLLFLLSLAVAVQAETWTKTYSGLLEKYVTPRGVRYAAWRDAPADRTALDSVIAAIASEKAPADRDVKLAFYLNAYNANILVGVLEKYPIKSIRNIAPLFGFFTQKRITVAGEKMSFNHLEKDIIIPLKEPRIHFALNCASASCPPLRNKAYTADNLAAELDEQATAFLNGNPRGVTVSDGGKKAAVSKIFDWNAGDFAPAGGPIGFINKYRKPPLPADAQVTFQDYDWSLNAAN